MNWSEIYPINIVTTKNSWFEKHAIEIMTQLKQLSFNSKLLYSHLDIDENAIVFYLSYQKIVPLAYIEKTFQSLVVHASDLPCGKGFSPWVWQILEGKNDIPVCLFQMEEGLDTGPIFQKAHLYLEGHELIEEIRIILAKLVQDMVLQHLQQAAIPECIPQVGMSTTYSKRTPLDSELDISKSIAHQFNLLRVVDNQSYPAYFWHSGKKYILTIAKQA